MLVSGLVRNNFSVFFHFHFPSVEDFIPSNGPLKAGRRRNEGVGGILQVMRLLLQRIIYFTFPSPLPFALHY